MPIAKRPITAKTTKKSSVCISISAPLLLGAVIFVNFASKGRFVIEKSNKFVISVKKDNRTRQCFYLTQMFIIGTIKVPSIAYKRGNIMLNQTHGAIKIFAGNSSKKLAEAICNRLDLQLGGLDVGKFSDGETSVNIKETVRGCDVFIIQSTSIPVNDNLMELLLIADACKRASAGRITAVIPYFGYARQDRKARSRDPISAKLVADILQAAGIDRVLTMDLHSSQLQGFFNIPVDNLMGMPVLARYFKKNLVCDNLTIVSPDMGSVVRSRAMAAKFNAPLAIIDKRRPKANVMEVMNVIGEIKGRTCLMLDDMIDTAGTICQGAQALMDNGAERVIACCSHAVLSGPAIERLQNSVLSKIVVLDTIELPEEKRLDKIEVVSIAHLFAEAIERVYTDLPVSKLFE